MQPVKNKKLTYLLICVVVAVWGIILYKVLFNESAEESNPNFQQAKISREPYDQYVAKKDTFVLKLNYRDPFGGKSAAVAVAESQVKTPAVMMPAKPVVVPPNWSSIKYTGYIINPKTKKTVSIVTVNGAERMIAEGESFQGVKLIKNKRDSILVSWLGKQKHIKQ